MYLDIVTTWLVTFCLLIPKANLQLPIQMYQMPPMMGFPQSLSHQAPFPMAFQIALPIPIPVKAQTTTTTTERSIMAIPLQFPLPIPVAIPAQPPPDFCIKKPRPPNCPVCPPCSCNPCIPAFFAYCSPCHQKCRCRNAGDTPVPQVAPMSLDASSPYMPAPYKHKRFPKRYRSNGNRYRIDDNIMDDSDSETEEWIPRSTHRRSYLTRRSYGTEIEDDDAFKPMLSYLTRDGSVKLEQELSDDEAEDLLEESPGQRVLVVAEEDAGNRQRLRVVSQNEQNPQRRNSNHRKRKVFLNSGTVQHMLAEGKKELVFSPPVDKKISNLSVSFQIT